MKRNELTSGNMSWHFNVGIRTWFDTEDAKGLRAQIINLLLDLSRKLAMLETSNQAVAVLAHKENPNDETTELKIQEFNNASVAMSD